MIRTKIILLVALAIILIISGIQFYHHRHFPLPIVAGPGVTKVIKLSNYLPAIKGSMVDTWIFFLQGQEPGGCALILGNTHANEPEGLLASLVMIENARVEKGSVIIIPQFNHSASRATRPGDGYPLYFDIPTSWGKKRFRLGNREASPLDQWPDPDVYIHYPERQLLSFIDARNVNRTWPGRDKGLPMEQVTYATMELIRKEKVDLVIDIHGAETMFPVTNCIVAPEKSARLATMVSLTVKAMEKFDNHVEPSPPKFRGLSHREIGDHSEAMPFLLEAPIPFLDQPTGPKTEKFLLDGKDPFLLRLAKKNKLFVPYDESGWPIEKRVGQHLSVTLEILRQFSRRTPERAIIIQDVPRYAQVIEKGVGFYFHDPSQAPKEKVFFN